MRFLADCKLGLRLVRRDARAGELHLLVLALALAVAAICSVGFLADRVARGLERDGARLLGGDVVLQADNAIPADFLAAAAAQGLRTAQALQFPSMAESDGDGQSASQTPPRLVSLKAVGEGYPLRGALRVAPDTYAPDALTRELPAPGTVWVDAQLLALLQVRVGDLIGLGDGQFRITRVITDEPDRGMQFINMSPRVLMRLDDLPATNLVQPASRVDYFLYAAGPPEAAARYTQWVRTHLQRGQKLATLESGRPELRRTLDRAQRFLSLVALLAVVIAAVAVALAARRFLQRHRDGMAVMRCLGADQTQVSRLLLAEFGVIGLLASAAGCVLGALAQQGLAFALAGLVDTRLPAPSAVPALQGLLTGLLLLCGFAWPSLAPLRRVPPARVLRHEDGALRINVYGYACGAFGLALLIWWFAGDIRLGAVVAGGFIGAFLAFALAGWVCLWALARLRQRLHGWPALRFALAGITRRRAAALTQVCALAVGLMALLLLTLTRGDLLTGWQRALPPDAPNRFLINIQTSQRDAVQQWLTDQGFGGAQLWPMIRGRLIEVNGHAVSAADYDNDRAQQLINREFNLSYGDHMPSSNRIAAGRWLAPDSRGEVSLETGLADRLRLHMGDLLRFDVAGQLVDVKVTSLRKVDWDSMQANFFAMLSPSALADAPQTWMTSFHLSQAPQAETSGETPPHAAPGGETKPQAAPSGATPAYVLRDLVARFPNVTIFDVGAILAQLQSVLSDAGRAVQGLFVFTLLAGVLVLACALTATRDERVREAAVLRALGATRAQLQGAQYVELLSIGALAGLLAAAGSVLVAWGLASQVFDFAIRWPWWPWLAGPLAGMLGSWAGGALALRGVLQTPPLVSLRA